MNCFCNFWSCFPCLFVPRSELFRFYNHIRLPFLYCFSCYLFFDKVAYSATMDFRTRSNLIKVPFVFIDHQVSIELDSTSRKDSCRRVRNRWHLLLTLHNNPSLQEHRRSDLFIQKSPFAAFQVMIQKDIVQYINQSENDGKPGTEDAKL